MSSMLEQAIIDATALKEAALKNAESAVIEKYSNEVKETLDKMLEQDMGIPGGAPMDMIPTNLEDEVEDPAPEAPLAALEGDKACPCPDEDEQIELDIDLTALSKAAADLSTDELGSVEDQEAVLQQVAESEDFEISDDILIELLSEDSEDLEDTEDSEINEEEEELTEEDVDDMSLEDELVDRIFEKLTVDLEPTLSGWAGRPSEHIEGEMELELARRRNDEVEEDVKALKKAVEELMQENGSLKNQNKKFSSAVVALKEKLDEVNLSNARLLYTNRILNSASLNERQKKKIVEAISNAGSVEEAKVICETLQSTVGSANQRRTPKSLSEAISRPSAVIRGSRKEKPSSDLVSDRLKKLAGIK